MEGYMSIPNPNTALPMEFFRFDDLIMIVNGRMKERLTDLWK
jgi:hypothetical protein